MFNRAERLHFSNHRIQKRKVSLFVLMGFAAIQLCSTRKVLGFAAEPRPKPPFHNVASILALTEEQARRGDPVKVLGVITGCTDYGVTLQDKTAGIWTEANRPHDFSLGEVVEVEGKTSPGTFSPIIIPSSIRIVGHSHLPVARKVTLRELLTGDEDAQYVQVQGVVRSTRSRPNVSPAQRVWMKLALDSGFLYVTLPASDADASSKLIGATIRVDAPALYSKDMDRHFTSAILAATNMRNIKIVRPPPQDIFGGPSLPTSLLLQYHSNTNSDSRVKVTGTVTYNQPGAFLVIENSRHALLVKTEQDTGIQTGDRITAAGFPTPADSGPYLDDAVVRYVGKGSVSAPTVASTSDLPSGRFNYMFVAITGRLLQKVREPLRQVLLIDSDGTLVRADLGDAKEPVPLVEAREGATVRVSGINLVDVEGSWNEGGPAASEIHSRLLLRSQVDVVEIKPPSWWTTTHLFLVSAILGVLAFVFFALSLYGRMQRWQLEVVVKERENLAHEIHDTLAQSFAGIGFQLQAIRKVVQQDQPDILKQVDLARSLVQYSHKEARRSIEPLNQHALHEIDLLLALTASAKRMVVGGGVEVLTAQTGHSQPISPRIANSLLDIGQEAIANAVRHADPKHVTISLAYECDTVTLIITDDGCGFVQSGDLLGFGLRGMRKRAASISAQLEITSAKGHGTKVRITSNISLPRGIRLILRRYWREKMGALES